MTTVNMFLRYHLCFDTQECIFVSMPLRFQLLILLHIVRGVYMAILHLTLLLRLLLMLLLLLLP